MPSPKRLVPSISDAEEKELQAAIAVDPDNPELSVDQIALLRPAAEVLPPQLYSALTRPRGRPKASVTKEPVKLRLDANVVASFRKDGPGWQTRMNAFLRVNATVLRLIEDQEILITNLERMLGHLRADDMWLASESPGQTVDRVEQNLRNVKETIKSLRDQLVLP